MSESGNGCYKARRKLRISENESSIIDFGTLVLQSEPLISQSEKKTPVKKRGIGEEVSTAYNAYTTDLEAFLGKTLYEGNRYKNSKASLTPNGLLSVIAKTTRISKSSVRKIKKDFLR